MHYSTPRKRVPGPPPPRHRRSSCCCPLAGLPPTPENPATVSRRHHRQHFKPREKTQIRSKLAASFPNSPQSNKPSLVDRILSPGRVSPIESNQESSVVLPPDTSPLRCSYTGSQPGETSHSPEGNTEDKSAKEQGSLGNLFDVRLSLKGKKGDSLVLELSSEVLSANSSVFANLIADYRNNSSSLATNLCRIEVPDVDNLKVFRDTIELMFEDDITKLLLKLGVRCSIDILEISAEIMFTKGVLSCLKYLEAVPWSDEEEERLRRLFTKFNFSDELSRDIVARLYSLNSADGQQMLARHLVSSITTCADESARHELKPLVKGLLCKSSVYVKDYPDLSKEDIIAVCQSCLGSLVFLFEEASGTNPCGKMAKKKTDMPLIKWISKQVDNINWLLEFLLDQQMAEDFVDMWTNQTVLLQMHKDTSPMVRYELSRVSAMLFIAIGTKQLHCGSEARQGLIQAWFRPMLLDFGWLKRCRKGLNVKVLQEAMGEALLTLPLKQQYIFFMEWFQCFSKHGTESPDLSKAFQIWWRRSFLKGSEPHAIEAR